MKTIKSLNSTGPGLRGVVFDFDDVILMTGMPWFRACQRLWRDHRGQLSVAQWNAIGEQQPAAVLEAFMRDPNRLSYTQACGLLELAASHAEAGIGLETVAPGVVTFMEQAREAGVPVGIGTNASRNWVDRWLPREIRALVLPAAIVTSDDVKPGRLKPFPDVYTEACKRLGVNPFEALAVEDTPIGAQAAIAAGMHCLIIPTEVTEVMAFPPGVMRAKSLELVSFNDVRSRINPPERLSHADLVPAYS